MTAPAPPGALDGLRVIELCGEAGAFAGKLLADMGADVVKVEAPPAPPQPPRWWEFWRPPPAKRGWWPAGTPSGRDYPPFVDDTPGPGRSLHFSHYNTSKRSVTLNILDDDGLALFRQLVAGADVLIEDRNPGEMERLGLDYDALKAAHPRLVMVSVTPFGQVGPRVGEAATDLTILAAGGPAWNCGYDDHSLPPVRGGGNQGYQTGCHYAVMSLLVALLHRELTGAGQHIDVNMHAAANVTTEAGSYTWLVSKQTVQRQTGRHAGVNMTMPSQIPCLDGRYVNTGIPPRRGHEFKLICEWLETLGLLEDFPMAPLLEAGAQRERIELARIADDPEAGAIFGAGREAVNLIAAHLPAYEFFIGAQQRGFQVGIVYSPEEALEDPHFKARGFPVEVEHPDLGRRFTYPGAPYQFKGSPWRIRRRAPLLGEDNAEVYGALGVTPRQLARLRRRGVV